MGTDRSKKMPEDVFIVGIYSTPAGEFPELSPKSLVRAAYAGALADARVDGANIGQVWFSNMMLDFWGQHNVRGQVCLMPLMEEGLLPAGTPITNVEGACASASFAFHGAWKDILSGQCDLSLAIGMEKMHTPSRHAELLARTAKCRDALNPEECEQLYKRTAADLGGRFDLRSGYVAPADIFALWARSHMARYGTTTRQMALAAAKSFANSVDNPRAQYRFPMDADSVLSDQTVSSPLTRSMCAPVGDAAAAALLCSGSYLKGMPASVRRRAIRVRGHAIASGGMKADWEGDRAPVLAARHAYRIAEATPNEIDVVEVHDATSFEEIHILEDMGFCRRGEGGPFTASGATQRRGQLPVNPSGGLVSRGHPIGATGLMMLNELCIQLRGEAASMQVPKARTGLAVNGGGLLGNDFAACSVTILDRVN